MGRAPCCDKANVKKGPWSPEEDTKLKSYIDHNGTGGNWIALPQKIGLKRCGKSCRLRWLNYLRPNIKHGGFSEEEDNIICNLYITIGSRWSIIAAQLPGRTDNDIKNYWNTRLKKKLLGKQRKEQAISGPARRRPANFGPKQEMIKREVISHNGSPNFEYENSAIDHHHRLLLLHSQFGSQPSYWPELAPLAMAGQPGSDDSVKNLLVKLGGRFSDGAATTNYPYPGMDHPNQHLISSGHGPVYQQASNFDMVTNFEASSDNQTAIFEIGLENLQAELSDLINYSNYEQAIISNSSEGLCGIEYDQVANNGTSISANSTISMESSSSSLVNNYPSTMVSGFDHHQVSSNCYFGTNDITI